MIQFFLHMTHKIFLTVIKRSITDIASTMTVNFSKTKETHYPVYFKLHCISTFIKFQIKTMPCFTRSFLDFIIIIGQPSLSWRVTFTRDCFSLKSYWRVKSFFPKARMNKNFYQGFFSSSSASCSVALLEV